MHTSQAPLSLQLSLAGPTSAAQPKTVAAPSMRGVFGDYHTRIQLCLRDAAPTAAAADWTGSTAEGVPEGTNGIRDFSCISPASVPHLCHISPTSVPHLCRICAASHPHLYHICAASHPHLCRISPASVPHLCRSSPTSVPHLCHISPASVSHLTHI